MVTTNKQPEITLFNYKTQGQMQKNYRKVCAVSWATCN